jgi:hypothetical protein
MMMSVVAHDVRMGLSRSYNQVTPKNEFRIGNAVRFPKSFGYLQSPKPERLDL